MGRWYAALRRRRGPVPAGLFGGVGVAIVAGLLFAALVVVPMDGCDDGDSKAGALFGAAVVGLLLTGWLLVAVVRRERHDLRAALGAAAAGSAFPAVLLAVGLAWVSSLPSGCPV
ncbi:hypothetical protein ACGFI9_24645 [Micromonospora sp. NPDC048930]|uniref:hypothetical protein n=1 Tax=Micromonospora sp. NPDC048930 TaxID=3364261 RepID=UPI00371729D4